jgi:hypothetical protein
MADKFTALRDELLAELIEQFSGNPAVRSKLERLRLAIQAADLGSDLSRSIKYAGKRAIDATLDYLDERGTPAELDAIVAHLIINGISPQTEERYRARNVKNSIQYWLTESWPSTTRPPIKQVNGLIGRAEWDDARFFQTPEAVNAT